jgi:hypothetical protein
MRRIISIALLTMSSSLSAQTLMQGAAVRVTGPTGTIEGALIDGGARGVTVRRNGATVQIPRGEIREMLREKRHSGAGAAFFGIPMALLGGSFTHGMSTAYCSRGEDCKARGSFLPGALLGGVLGAGVGAAIGSMVRTWVPVNPRELKVVQ